MKFLRRLFEASAKQNYEKQASIISIISISFIILSLVAVFFIFNIKMTIIKDGIFSSSDDGRCSIFLEDVDLELLNERIEIEALINSRKIKFSTNQAQVEERGIRLICNEEQKELVKAMNNDIKVDILLRNLKLRDIIFSDI